MQNKKSKRKIVATVFTVITILLLTAISVSKLVKAPVITERFTQLGLMNHLTHLAFATIAFTVLYGFPKTMKIGLFLLSCYFGGAIAINLEHGMMPIQPVVLLAILWINAFVRNREIFISSK